MLHPKGPGLYEFLIEAELQQYFFPLKNDLKIQNVAHLKYVEEQDLFQLGMSKPEVRRLRKYYEKHYPQNYIAKIIKKVRSKDDRNNGELVFPDVHALENNATTRRVPNKHIIPVDRITVIRELGTGEFGVVQQGIWTSDEGRIQVAIKCLNRERMQNPSEFLDEAAIMHTIDHEHIVRLYGVVLEPKAAMLVTELAPNRSLLECLKDPKFRLSCPVPTLCDFSIQICDGMQYLENQRFIHRDLAARNILVFSENKVKISDFGLSRALGVGKDYYQTNFNVNLKLPIAWCAPECINYLRFTSASDVWAYGVTLWEMFSYGFQPWAALTGHQILEAIDEPNFQRLEHPECCPKEYYNLMLKCWQHDPDQRPRFKDLMKMLPECKPEQVQAIRNSSDERAKKRDQLAFRVGDVITVIDKTPLPSVPNVWKGVLNNGKTGLFNPAHTVAYIGSNLPSSKPGDFVRGESKIYASKRRIKPEMISCPQGEVKHTGHVGLDGSYFGDISFFSPGPKYNLPHQIVTPYKPQDDCTNLMEPSTPSKISDRAPLLSPDKRKSTPSSGIWLDYESIKPTCQVGSKSSKLADHEYHEIGNEEVNAESPRFEKTFDFGPSLSDEMDHIIRTLGTQVNNSMVAGISNYASSPPPSPLDADINKCNELREIEASVAAAATTYKGKKKAMVKPIRAADEKALDSAIAMVNEMAVRTMHDLDAKLGPQPDSPVTPVSPNKRKFSFRFPTPVVSGHSSRPEGKTFSDEAASIPDLQTLRRSLSSLSSCCSVESLKETTPFRIAPWDQTSTNMCFARSHALLTKHHPTLYSLDELNALPPEEGELVPNGETNAGLLNGNGDCGRQISSCIDLSLEAGESGLQQLKRNLQSQLSTSVDLACESEFEGCLSEEAKVAYNTLIEQPTVSNAIVMTHVPPVLETVSPLKMLKAVPVVRMKNRVSKNQVGCITDSTSPKTDAEEAGIDKPGSEASDADKTDVGNAIPLPPRDRSKSLNVAKPRHQRKHPLIIPGGEQRLLEKVLNVENELAANSCNTDERLINNGTDFKLNSKFNSAEPSDDTFDQRIASQLDALDNLQMDPLAFPPKTAASRESPTTNDVAKSAVDDTKTLFAASGNVPSESVAVDAKSAGNRASCEDLLDLAGDRAESEKKSNGKEKGTQSDEVRIMEKVLGPKVSGEMCVSALNITDWDVHRAIKLARLESLLMNDSRTRSMTDSVTNISALEAMNWDVAKAATLIIENLKLS